MRPAFCAAALLVLAQPLWAQTNPPQTEIGPLLDRLSARSTRDAALEQLKKLPASAIVPLTDAANDPSRSREIRQAIMTGIEGIAARERTARAAESARALREWNSNTSVKIYEKKGADPKWDAAVRKGFELFDRNQFAEAHEAFSEAAKAGCTDPLVLFNRDYCAIISTKDRGPLYDPIIKSFKDFEASDYPNSRKCAVEASFAALTMDLDRKGPVPDSLRKSALRRGKEYFKDLVADGAGPIALRHVAINLYAADGKILGPLKGSSKECVDILAAAMPGNVLGYVLKANFYTEWAWEARGGGFASTVTPDGFKNFRERLVEARKIAEEGWRLDPLDADCPASMIQICMGLSLDTEEMESWFKRAMIADPHHYNACLAKQQYLLPKWGGSVQESIEFARFCVAHGDAQDRIPTILLRTYGELAEFSSGGNPLFSSPQYWADIKSVFTKLLADKSRLQTHRAQYLADRGAYIRAACDVGRWADASALMREFGNEIDVSAVGGQALYDYFKRKAEQAVGAAGSR